MDRASIVTLARSRLLATAVHDIVTNPVAAFISQARDFRLFSLWLALC
jgi:hypothetical protein